MPISVATLSVEANPEVPGAHTQNQEAYTQYQAEKPRKTPNGREAFHFQGAASHYAWNVGVVVWDSQSAVRAWMASRLVLCIWCERTLRLTLAIARLRDEAGVYMSLMKRSGPLYRYL